MYPVACVSPQGINLLACVALCPDGVPEREQTSSRSAVDELERRPLVEEEKKEEEEEAEEEEEKDKWRRCKLYYVLFFCI